MELKTIMIPLLIFSNSSLCTTFTNEECFFSQMQTVETFNVTNEYSNIANNIIESTESDSFIRHMRENIDRIIFELKELIGENNIDYEEENYAQNYLDELRKNDDYELFLIQLPLVHDKVVKSILLYLSNINFENIFAFEEKFVIEILKSGNVQLQEYALNTITIWNNISDVEILKSITIANRYLNKDLKDFILNIH